MKVLLNPSVANVLKKISDDKTLTLFNSIAVSNGDRYIHLREMSLTPKQYYSRLSGLMAGNDSIFSLFISLKAFLFPLKRHSAFKTSMKLTL
jgi:hypothetical protein